MNKELIISIIDYGMGGAQRRALSLADHFVKKGYTVYVLAVSGNDHTVSIEKYYDIDERVNLVLIPEYYEKHKTDKSVVECENKINKKIALLKKLQSIFKSFGKLTETINFNISGLRKCIALRSFMISHKGATVINFGFNIFERLYFAVKGLSCKVIYAETNSSNSFSLRQFFEKINSKIIKSDALVFQTTEEKAQHGLTNSRKAFVIHNPVKTDLPLPFEGTRNKTIVNFCRLAQQKNLPLLIRAFEKFHYEFPDYKLEIYADTMGPTDFEYKDTLMSYVREKELTDCIFLLPPSSDIHNIILKSAMFVSSSDYEGISNSMIEAMAIGLPCVCTDCDGGGAREMITDGENGLLVPKGNADALKMAMVRMVTEKGLAEKCSKNAAKIRETHSIEKISKKWIEVIEKVNGD